MYINIINTYVHTYIQTMYSIRQNKVNVYKYKHIYTKITHVVTYNIHTYVYT